MNAWIMLILFSISFAAFGIKISGESELEDMIADTLALTMCLAWVAFALLGGLS